MRLEFFVLRRARALALAVWSAAFPAWGVSVDPQGVGQVLLYPYYTARASVSGNPYTTLFTVSNTTTDTKVVRVRFRESRNGREVGSINVYLGPHDSWTGAVLAETDSAGIVTIVTYDESCTEPASVKVSHRLPFTNVRYSGSNADGEDASLARALEGYFEVFELGVVKDATVTASLDPYANPVANCPAALAVTLDNATKVGRPSGGLAGWANIVNVGDGTLYSYDATALVDFSAVPLWSPASSATPTLADVNPKVSRVFDGAGAHDATWDVAKGASPVDPVSAVLMASQLLSWYVLDPATSSSTEWIVTMPTKPFHVDAAIAPGAAPSLPFESAFGPGGSPDYFGDFPIDDCSVGFDRTIPFDREGRSEGQVCTLPPPPSRAVLPWTANVIRFQPSDLFGSMTSSRYATPWPNGWAKLAPFQYENRQVHQLVSTDATPVRFFGLPMIGFAANDYVNRTLSLSGVNVLSNYGATSPLKALRRIE